MSAKYVDLHIHTQCSDGVVAPEEIPRLASRAGLKVVAITDHDAVDGIERAFAGNACDGLEIVPGVELSTTAGGADVHILGYYIDWQDRTLLEWVAFFREKRLERARKMVERLRVIHRLNWHPFMRINQGGTFRQATGRAFKPLKDFVPCPGTSWKGTGKAFKTKPLSCTLLALWEEGTEEPWLIVTDLPPEASDACWYGLRAWIEQGFKITKRSGWQWHRTRMTDPQRAERLWLAIAVATLWLVSVGGQTEDAIPESTFLDVSVALQQRKRHRKATQLRLVSIFRRGWCRILGALFRQTALPLGVFVPEPWPRGLAFEEQERLPRQLYRTKGKKTYP